MNRGMLLALSGIGFLLVGGVVLVLSVDGATSPGEVAAPPVSVVPVEPPADRSVPRVTLPATVPEPAAADSQEPPARDPAQLVRELEPMRREVFTGLADLEGRVRACRLRDEQIVLTLEALDGAVRVAGVRVLPLPVGDGPSDGDPPTERDDPAARCTRGALLGQLLPVPSARDGRRWDMHWAPGAAP